MRLKFHFCPSIINMIPYAVVSPSGIVSQFTIDEFNKKVAKHREDVMYEIIDTMG